MGSVQYTGGMPTHDSVTGACSGGTVHASAPRLQVPKGDAEEITATIQKDCTIVFGARIIPIPQVSTAAQDPRVTTTRLPVHSGLVTHGKSGTISPNNDPGLEPPIDPCQSVSYCKTEGVQTLHDAADFTLNEIDTYELYQQQSPSTWYVEGGGQAHYLTDGWYVKDFGSTPLGSCGNEPCIYFQAYAEFGYQGPFDPTGKLFDNDYVNFHEAYPATASTFCDLSYTYTNGFPGFHWSQTCFAMQTP